MVQFRGFPACECLAEWLPVFERALLRAGVIRHSIDIAQLVGGYSKSGGTHLPGGAFDIWQHDKTTVKIARNMGAAAWGRTRAQGFDPHCHGVLKGCPHNDGGRYQIAELENGGDGLLGSRKDDGPRVGVRWPLRTWREGIAWAEAQEPKPFGLRVGTFNLPDSTKLPNVLARIKAGAELVDRAKLDVLGLNEMVGRKSSGKPSDHARAFRDAVEDATNLAWHLTTPTTTLNENYVLTRDATVRVASQWGDSIIRVAGVPGRHLTRIVAEHVQTRRKFGFGVTHLVNDNRPGAQAQSVPLGKAIAAIGESHDCPVIVVGDMNTSDDLTGLAKIGMVNTRKKAKATTNTGYATYTKYAAEHPSKNTDWRIDQIWATRTGLTVTGQTLILDAPGGTFDKPRASDHGLLVTALVYA